MSIDDRALKRIVPFSIQIEIKFNPDQRFNAYRISATGKAELNNIDTVVKVAPLVTLMNAQWLCDLCFGIHVDANAMVPLMNKANKE